jgi:hypothetical protein
MVFIQRLRVDWELANYNDLGLAWSASLPTSAKNPQGVSTCGFGKFWW